MRARRQRDCLPHIPSSVPLCVWPAAAVAGMIALWLLLTAPVLTSTSARRVAPVRGPAAQGKQSFVSHCGACHGLDGRGGEHAPDIATRPIVQNLSGMQLERIVRDGIPAQGMPSFRALGPAEIKAVVDYLRILQGAQRPAVVHGNPHHGRDLFFGGARCSRCHMIQGRGGFLGSDLTTYSLTHSPRQIREEIVDPARNLGSAAQTVMAVTHDGRKLIGIARNEDNFSLQLQTADGAFHLLMKSDLRELQHRPESLMPSDYGSKLSARDLDDVGSFLVKAGETATRARRGNEPD